MDLVSNDLKSFLGEYSKQIILKSYDKGIYLLEIKNNHKIITKKLMLN